MDKKYFFVKLIPRRPDFAQTMSDAERAIMKEHAAYWASFMEQGKILVYGPVFDPKGTYGAGVMAVENEEEVLAFTANDPAAQINDFEYYPMRAIMPNTAPA
jgi:uncharacterized protein YciI